MAALLSLGTVASLISATPSMAAKHYYPSITLSHLTGVKVGETLQVTGKGFPPSTAVTLHQCNQGLLDAPHGVVTKATCDLANSPKTKSSSTGTIAAAIKVEVKDVNGEVATCISAHSSFFDAWGWICFGADRSPYLTSSPTETWLNPQTVALKGLHIPAAATGSADFAAECNDNVLKADTSACGTPVAITVGSTGKVKGKLSVVTGTVGDGTCGTGTADEVCYIVLVNVPSGGTPSLVAIEAINFYEGK
jgi:hypothetical protein